MKQRIATTIVLFYIICLSAIIFWQVRVSELNHSREGFQRDVTSKIKALEVQSVRSQTKLKKWQRRYADSDAFSASEFKRLAAAMLEANPEFDLITWAQVVPHNQRLAFEKNIQRPFFDVSIPPSIADSNLLTYLMNTNVEKQITRVADDNLYLPLLAGEPSERVNMLIGLDIKRLRDFGLDVGFESVVEKPEYESLPLFSLAFDGGEQKLATLLIPMLAFDVNSANMNALVRLKGLVSVSFSLTKLFKEYGLDEFGVSRIEISEMNDETGLPNTLIYQEGDSNIKLLEDTFTSTFKMFGKDLRIVAEPSVSYLKSKRNNTIAYLIVAASILMSLIYILSIMTSSRHRDAKVTRRIQHEANRLEQDNQVLSKENQELESLMRVDALTDISNRRYFDEVSNKEWARALREQTPLVILMLDVDHFKAYNDIYGHVKGDEALYKVAQSLKSVCSRSSDVVARYGGEEFAAILPSTGHDALRVAERCRAAVAALKIEHKGSTSSDRVTISAGMSSVIPSHDSSLETLIRSADKALYLAKLQGRNRVIFHSVLQETEE